MTADDELQLVHLQFALTTATSHIMAKGISLNAADCTSTHCEIQPFGSIALCAKTPVNLTDSNPSSTQLTEWRANITTYLDDYHRTVYFGDEPLIRVVEMMPILKSQKYVVVVPSYFPLVKYPDPIYQATAVEFLIAYSTTEVDMISDQRFIDVEKFHFLSMTYYYCTKRFSDHPSQEDIQDMMSSWEGSTDVVSSSVTTLNSFWNQDYIRMERVSTIDGELLECHLEQSLVLRPPPNVNETGIYKIDACTGLVFSNLVNTLVTGIWAGQHSEKGSSIRTGHLAAALARSLSGKIGMDMNGLKQLSRDIAYELSKL